jgi:DNA-binding transcriptional MocR family regulator
MNAMRLAVGAVTKPGDTIAVESPTFFGLLPMLRDAGLLVIEVATDPMKGIDLDAFESIAEKHALAAAIVTPSFHNPTGACMAPEAKERLLGLARAHRFHLIEDDVYGDLYFGTRRPRPIASKVGPHDGFSYCSSFSKTLSAGLRVGFVVSRTHTEALARAKLSSTISSPVFNQRVIARFLATGAYERHLRRLREALRRQMRAAIDSLARNLPEQIEVTNPQGGFVLWVRLPKGVSSLELYEVAAAKGISILPGVVCAIDNRYAGYIRVSCGYPWSDVLERGVERLGRLVREQQRTIR